MMLSRFLHYYCAAFLLFGASSVFSQEVYSQWAHSKDIAINTSASGYGISGNVSNFPYLIRLSEINFDFSQAAKDGGDIRFANAYGTHLSYEIEKWDSTQRKAFVWVRVDTIKGNNSTQSIKMHWGKSGVSSKSDGPSVFDTANGFVGVWHLNNDFSDATINANNGTNNGATDRAAWHGNNFDGTQYISVNDANSLNLTNNMTVSAWIYPASLTGVHRVYRKGTASVSGYGWGTNGTNLRFTTYGIRDYNAASSGLATSTWYLATAAMNSSNNVTFYVNGGNPETVTGTNRATTSTDAFYIGSGTAGEMWNGGLDEIRLEKTVRSADWIKLCYQNQQYILAAAPVIRYPQDTFVVTKDSLLAITPSISEEFDFLSITPADLPMFLSFNNNTGEFSGWFYSDISSPVTFYVRASNAKGYTEDTVTFKGPGLTSIGVRKKQSASAEPRLLGIRDGMKKKIVFYVPSTAAIHSLEFVMFDLKGAVVWSEHMDAAQLFSGVQAIAIAKGIALSKGVYLLVMKAIPGKQTFMLQKAIVTYLNN